MANIVVKTERRFGDFVKKIPNMEKKLKNNKPLYLSNIDERSSTEIGRC
ncbi:uncharacterized protein G2W53_018414 [Senna tora]|uniref:Uncharacterized protein n=1 Tax=Senna tora TaxID=362788 RepID=A0A834TRQ7_9FABA|nr:uncharacterized protein G2W53_018414 [Senna tora]